MLNKHYDISSFIMQPEIERELVRSASDSRTRTAVGNGATLLDHLGMDRENRRGGDGEEGGGGEEEEMSRRTWKEMKGKE